MKHLLDVNILHGFKLATFDGRIKHPSVELVS